MYKLLEEIKNENINKDILNYIKYLNDVTTNYFKIYIDTASKIKSKISIELNNMYINYNQECSLCIWVEEDEYSELIDLIVPKGYKNLFEKYNYVCDFNFFIKFLFYFQDEHINKIEKINKKNKDFLRQLGNCLPFPWEKEEEKKEVAEMLINMSKKFNISIVKLIKDLQNIADALDKKWHLINTGTEEYEYDDLSIYNNAFTAFLPLDNKKSMIDRTENSIRRDLEIMPVKVRKRILEELFDFEIRNDD